MIQLSPANLRETLERHGRSGQYLVCGMSDEVNSSVQELLDTWTRRERDIYYFLCSGSQAFSVPCYRLERGASQGGELPSTEAILNEVRKKSSSPQQSAQQLEQVLAGYPAHLAPLVITECITPPSLTDMIFIERLLAFTANRKDLLAVSFLHQDALPQSTAFLHQIDKSREDLLLLYLCGGRVRATDWYRLTGSQAFLTLGENAHPWITSRRVGPAVWLCYARRQAAQWAATTFGSLEGKEQEYLIRKVLDTVQCSSDYPTLALAAEVENLDLRLARHAFPGLECALTTPRTMAKYFYRLRRCAQQRGDTELVAIATLDYLTSLLSLSGTQPIRLYKVLSNFHSYRDKRSLARLYGEIGQRLVKAKDVFRLGAAAECFQKSRRCLEEVEDLAAEEKYSALAALANGEALLAFKRGQPELACQIEKIGLEGLLHTTASSLLAAQKVLLTTNLGDVYLRLLHDRDAAMRQYQIAYHLSITWSSVAMQAYIVPKLAEAYIQNGQQEQAIEILEPFLARSAGGPYPLLEERIALKARLTLAQAYWQVGRSRRAAFWYWRLLQRSHCLAPATLKGIVFNLQLCRPGMPQQLQARLDDIVSNQEETLASIKHIRDYLTRM